MPSKGSSGRRSCLARSFTPPRGSRPGGCSPTAAGCCAPSAWVRAALRRSARPMRSPTACIGRGSTTAGTSVTAPLSARAAPPEALMPFEHPSPHVIELEVQARDIDAYDHVNNAVYLTWLDRAAWSHSAALGVPLEKCVALRRGMAALRTEIDFVRAALRGDRVRVATWIAVADRLRVERRFQVLRAADGRRTARPRPEYVCINLDSGRAVRMPELFARAYVVTAG